MCFRPTKRGNPVFFLIAMLLAATLISPATQAEEWPIVAYGHGAEYSAVLPLSDGTVLVAGGGASLSWVPAGVPIDTLTVPQTRKSSADTTVFGIASSSPGQVGYILHLSGDYQQLLRVTAMPPGLVPDVVKLKATNVPGQVTGAIYISGRRVHGSVEGYYIGRLNGNYIGGNRPTALDWSFDVRSLKRRHNMGAASPFPADVESDVRRYQPWDVTAEGKVYFVLDRDFSDDWCAIHRLKATGELDVVENWRAHWTGDGTRTENRGPSMRFTPASSFAGPGTLRSSGIILKLNRNGHLRSATQQEFDSLMVDENGQSGRKGTYPDDFLFDAPLAMTAGNFAPASNPGYTGMSPNLNGNNTATPRCVALTVDRTNGSLYFGYSVYSSSPSSGVHDFEPAVVAMDSSGKLEWWARCYPTNAQHSPAQQHIDHLAIDYTNSRLVVAGRTWGGGANDFWQGNFISLKPGGNGFLNQYTGSSRSAYVSWLGTFSTIGANKGKILAATYVGEAADTLAGAPYANAAYSSFPDLNLANVALGNTETEDLTIMPDGGIAWAGKANRAMTTTNAMQPMLSFGQGAVRPQSVVRVYNAALDSVRYSSMFGITWNEKVKGTTQPLGSLKLAPSASGNSLYVVGIQREAAQIGNMRRPIWADSVARISGLQRTAPVFASIPLLAPVTAPLAKPDSVFMSRSASGCIGAADTFRVRRLPNATAVVWSLSPGWDGYSEDTILIARSTIQATGVGSLTVAYMDSFKRGPQLIVSLPIPARPAGNVVSVRATPQANQLCVGQPFILESSRTGGVLRYEFTSSNALWVPTAGTDTSSTYLVPSLTDTSSLFIRGVNACGAGPWRRVLIPRPLAKPARPVITDSSGFLVSSVSTGINWYDGGVLIPGATSRLLPIRNGSFTVVATNRCGADTSLVRVVTTLAKETVLATLKLHPNPVHGKHLTVTISEAGSEQPAVKLYNAMGQQLTLPQPTWQVNQGASTILNVSHLSAGHYWLVVEGHKAAGFLVH